MSAPYKKSNFRGRGGATSGGHGGRGGPQGGHRGGGGGGGGGSGRDGGGRGNDRAEQTKHSDVLTAMLNLLFEKQASKLYDPSSGLLNLSNFRECPDLSAVQKSVDFNAVAFCGSLVKVIQEKIGLPRFLNLNNNSILTLVPFLGALKDAGLHESVGGVSACNNLIKDFGFLGVLKKFSSLQELVLTGNTHVTSKDNYLREITKSLPALLGLDGQSVARAPLALPYPIRPSLSSDAISVLQILEISLLKQLSDKNLDSLLGLYHSKATWSYTTETNFLFSRNSKASKESKCSKDFQFDLQYRSLSVNHRRDLMRPELARNISFGKAHIRNHQEKNIYFKKFSVQHLVDSAANVVFLTENMKVPTCIVTIHGKMQWVHSVCTDDVVTCCFDRTLSLVFTQSWEIVTDMIHLRQDKPETLFFADNPSVVDQLQRKYSLNAEIIRALVQQASSESDLSWLLADMTPQLMEECTPLAQNNSSTLVALVRVCSRLQTNAAQASQLLAAHGFNATAAIAAATGKA